MNRQISIDSFNTKIVKSEFQTVNMPGWPSIKIYDEGFTKEAIVFKCINFAKFLKFCFYFKKIFLWFQTTI